MISCCISDVGNVKDVNQDAIFCKHLIINNQYCVFGCVCDGLGGLSGGEIASSNAVRSLSDWFSSQYPYIFDDEQQISSSLQSNIYTFNSKLYKYSQKQHTQMGTTVSGILLNNYKYYTVNTGDSRVYLIRSKSLTQLTKDHSYIQREIDAGRMSIAEAKKSPQQSLLTYCIGFSEQTVVDITGGSYQEHDIFFFCSDGARHKILDEEFIQFFSDITSKDILRQRLTDIVSLCKARGETDNISIGAVIV